MIDLPVDFDKLKITINETQVNQKGINCKLPNPFSGNNIDCLIASSEGCQLCCFNRCKESILKKTKFQHNQDSPYNSIEKSCCSSEMKTITNKNTRNKQQQSICNKKPVLRPTWICAHSYRRSRRNFHKYKNSPSKKNNGKKAAKSLSNKEISNFIALDTKCFVKQNVYNVSPYTCTNIKGVTLPVNKTSSQKQHQHQRSCNIHTENTLSSLENTVFRFTPCSQQASNGPTNDDITIDELASYFDTLVHIPKKMSSMAEMMYI